MTPITTVIQRPPRFNTVFQAAQGASRMSATTTVIQQPPRFRTLIKARGHTLDITPERREIAVMQITAGFMGGTGSASISTDPDNAITVGTDGGLYAPHPQLATAQW